MAAAATAETWEQTRSVEHLGMLDANQFFNRQEIELEAWQLISNRDQIPQPEVRAKEYRDNSRTAIMEALTASGHLSRVVLTGNLEEIESQMVGRLLNGWNDNLPQHEKDRRFAELCNVLYGSKVRASIVAGELPENTAILEISDYPGPLAGTNLGYRDKNKKGMVRSTLLSSLGDEQYELTIEQISRSNATADSTFTFFNACGIDLNTDYKSPDLAGLEKIIIYSIHDYADGVVDVMRLLDQYAGHDVLYGDADETKAKHVAYESLRQESERREREVEIFIDDLAILGEQLDDMVKLGQMTQQERNSNFNEEVVRILAAICTLEPDYAEATFGEKVAPSFQEAAVLAAQGKVEQAQQVLDRTIHLRETVTFCGASISVEDAKEKGLKVNSYSDLVNKGKEKWSWKDGVCVVKACPTRPGKTKVGPCSICKNCQKQFDRGKDPTKRYQPKIEHKRGEPLAIKKNKAKQRLGRTALNSQSERYRGEPSNIDRSKTGPISRRPGL